MPTTSGSPTGQPEGQADIYWLNAQREILTTSVESLGSNAPAAAPTDTGLVATKSAKKAKGRPIGKKQNPRRIVPCEHNDDSVISGGGSPAPPLVRRNESTPIFRNGETIGIVVVYDHRCHLLSRTCHRPIRVSGSERYARWAEIRSRQQRESAKASHGVAGFGEDPRHWQKWDFRSWQILLQTNEIS